MKKSKASFLYPRNSIGKPQFTIFFSCRDLKDYMDPGWDPLFKGIRIINSSVKSTDENPYENLYNIILKYIYEYEMGF